MKRCQDLDFMSKRWKISYNTFRNWQCNLDKDCQMLMRLDCDSSTEKVKKFVDWLNARCVWNSEPDWLVINTSVIKWIVGAESVCTSNVSDQHSRLCVYWAQSWWTRSMFICTHCTSITYSCQRPFRWNQIVFSHSYNVSDANVSVSTMAFIAFPEGHKVFSGPSLPKVTHQSLNEVPTS